MNLIDSIDNAILQMAGRHTGLSNQIIEKLTEAKRLAVLEELTYQHMTENTYIQSVDTYRAKVLGEWLPDEDENLPGARRYPYEYKEG